MYVLWDPAGIIPRLSPTMIRRLEDAVQRYKDEGGTFPPPTPAQIGESNLIEEYEVE